jgi:hypothetical protein
MRLIQETPNGKVTSMAEKRRQESEWGSERERSRFREERRAQLETAATRRRIKERFFLREDEWDEEETHILKNSKRPR